MRAVSGHTEAGRAAETSLCARLPSAQRPLSTGPRNPSPVETLVHVVKAGEAGGGGTQKKF